MRTFPSDTLKYFAISSMILLFAKFLFAGSFTLILKTVSLSFISDVERAQSKRRNEVEFFRLPSRGAYTRRSAFTKDSFFVPGVALTFTYIIFRKLNVESRR